MSSILDALKKLEEDKAAAKQPSDHTIDSDTARHDLVGHGVWGRASGARLSPLLIIGGILVISGVLVAVSVTVAVYITMAHTGAAAPQPESPDVASVTQEAETPPSAEASSTETQAEDRDEFSMIEAPLAATPGPIERLQQDPAPPPRPDTPTSRPTTTTTEQNNGQIKQETPAPAADTTATPDAEEIALDDDEQEIADEVQVAAEEPPEAADEVEEERAAPSPQLRTRERLASAPESHRAETRPESPTRERAEEAMPELPSDIRALPPLTEAARRDHGLEDMRINMLRAPSENRPRPSALINYTTLYLGDKIPDTEARLIAIEVHGIAIKVDGAQYFVRR